MGKRNLVQKAIHDYRKWGETFRDRTKYHRGSPNHHELDQEVEEALNARNGESDRHSPEFDSGST